MGWRHRGASMHRVQPGARIHYGGQSNVLLGAKNKHHGSFACLLYFSCFLLSRRAGPEMGMEQRALLCRANDPLTRAVSQSISEFLILAEITKSVIYLSECVRTE